MDKGNRSNNDQDVYLNRISEVLASERIWCLLSFTVSIRFDQIPAIIKRLTEHTTWVFVKPEPHIK